MKSNIAKLLKYTAMAALTVTTLVAEANSLREDCNLPGGLHFGESIMLSSEINRPENSFNDTQLVENSAAGWIRLGILSNQFNFYATEQGSSFALSSPDGQRTYTFRALANSKQVGYWRSNADASAEEQRCSPYADFTTVEIPFAVTLTRKGGAADITVNTLVTCTIAGGYHGYWGHIPECPYPN